MEKNGINYPDPIEDDPIQISEEELEDELAKLEQEDRMEDEI